MQVDATVIPPLLGVQSHWPSPSFFWNLKEAYDVVCSGGGLNEYQATEANGENRRLERRELPPQLGAHALGGLSGIPRSGLL
jgi:hypothetical protein